MSMKRKTILALLLSALLALSACGSSAQGQSGSETSSQSASSQSVSSSAENQELASQLFSDRDLEIGYDEKQAFNITLTGDSASWEGEGVTADGTSVTITREGVYLLSGTLDGMVVVNVSEEEKVQLVLDGVDISSATSAAIYVSSADKVFITTAADSVNTLENGGEYIAIDDNNIDGVIFAKSDLTLNGAGSLIIQGEAEHGVVTKDDLVVTSGIYDVTVGGHGLSGKDSVAICGGTFTFNTGKDGVQSDNDEDSEKGYVYLSGGDFTIVAQGDGFSASSWMQVDGGVYNVTTGGGSANGEEHTDSMFPDRGGMGGMRGPGGMSGGAPQDDAGQPGTQPFQEGEASSAASQGTTPSSQTMTATPLASNTETAQEEERSDTPSTKGFKAGSWLTIGGGEFQLDCADDAFHSNGDLTFLDGSVELSTGDDAFHADQTLSVEGGDIQILTSYEGLEGQSVNIHGGVISILSSDDGINAAADGVARDEVFINITGGSVTVDAGGDGLDSNGDITISGGTVYVSGVENSADFALDYDGSAAITGGTFIGTGGSGMAQNFGEDSTQGSILLTVSSQSAGSTLSLSDQSGNILASWEAPKGYQAVVISCPGLEKGGTYTVTTGPETTEVTLDSLIYGSGGRGGFGGGMRGGGMRDSTGSGTDGGMDGAPGGRGQRP